MANLSNYIGDAQQRPEEPQQNALERGINLLDVAAKSAAYSALQQPMDGICQLAGAKAPKLIGEGKQYEFNTPEWYASTIGHGAGFMLPYMATSKLTALAGMKAGIGKAMFDGAVSGFAMTPTADGENALTSRGLAAFSSSVMFGSQHLIAGQLTSRMVGAAESAPILTRLGINTASGVGAGLTSLEATSLIQGQGFVTDKQTLLENAVAAGATGFALDAFNIATTRRISAPKDGSAQAPAQHSDGIEKGSLKAAEVGDSKVPPNSGLVTDYYAQVGEWTVPTDGVIGAKQYKMVGGQTFWQIPDGRIYYEEGSPENPVFKTWSPFGSGDPATFLGPEQKYGRQIWTRHEPQGFFFNHEGTQHGAELYNLFEDADVATKPDLTRKQKLDLTLSVPLNVEPDWLSFARIKRTADGALYEPTTINIREFKGGKPPMGLTMTDYINNWTEEKTVPARRYQILNAEGTQHTSIVVPEPYAQKLDHIRELRQFATQDPSKSPDIRDEILRARRELFVSGYGDRLLPEHWGQFIDILPNPKTISELQLVDSRDPEGSTIADTSIPEGRIRFYAENNGIQQHVRRTLGHEWAHTAEKTQQTLREAYETATKVEQFNGRDYAETNVHEDWAVHFAEMLMDPNHELFLTLANKAPVRTVLLGEALRRELNASTEHTSMNKEELETRLRFIDENVVPVAKEQVMNSMRTSDLRRLSDTSQLISRLMHSDLPADKELANKLVDKDVIAKGIDRGIEHLNKEFDSSVAARTLQRMELLRQLDPEMAAPRIEQATDITARLRTRITRLLASNEPDIVSGALDVGEGLFRGMADSEVFRRTFPFESLADVAQKNPSTESATRAFNLIKGSFAAPRVNELALDIIKNKGSARGSAAEWAMTSSSTQFVGEATAELSRQLRNGDSSALTPETMTALYKTLDATISNITSGKETGLEPALRTLARGRLLQDIVMARFQLGDPIMQARTQRVTQLENTVRNLIESGRTGPNADPKAVDHALGLMPKGMMDPPENSSGIILL